jgi:2-polyprenyl-3-methyl-5-hydroxy-6-metoxy-1,4-benzoquinol methylase
MQGKKFEKINCNYCGSLDSRVVYIKQGFNIVQCKSCSLVYVNPRLTQEEIFKLYDEPYFKGSGFDKSIQYQKEFENKSTSRDLLIWDITTIREMLRTNTPTPKLLDVGCGMGLFLHKAKQNGFVSEGLELSNYACNFARSKNILVHNTSIDEFELPKNSFDVISMREVIEHLSSPITSLQKIYNGLKPGGILFITTGNYNCPERKVRGSNWNYFMPEGHLTIFSNQTLKMFLVKTGFKQVLVTNQGDLMMNLLFKLGILETDKFKPVNIAKRILFELVRGLNHYISSGLRAYAIK